MVDAFQVTDYFSRVLRRGQLEGVSFQDDSLFVATPRTRLTTGSLSVEDASKLFANHDKETSRSSTAPKKLPGSQQPAATEPEGLAEGKPISVVVSLLSLHQPSLRGGAGQSGLLLLAAKLFRDGRLEPELETASSPWIPSERLDSPSVSGLDVMVGAQSDFWRYSRSVLGAGVSQSESFEDAMELATRLFEEVSGDTLEEFAAEQQMRGKSIEYELCYIKELDRINAVGGLLEIYDFLSREKKMPAPVKRMATGWRAERPHEKKIHEGYGLYEAAKKSCGSMTDGFPLTDSQRRAVHAFLDESGSEITAVSGPPGTGKTTMLQAVVANLLTRRALDQGAPPVIVGTSTNNQAVTNIISSFAAVTKDEPGTLDFRWLPQELNGQASADESLRSLAVYCPSTMKLDEAKTKYLVEQRDKNHTYTAYSSAEYIAGAKDRFVMSAQAYFGAVTDVPQLQQWIHDALTELERFRIDLIESMRSHGPSKYYKTLCSKVEVSQYLGTISQVSELKECDSLERLDQLLDVTLRYAQFWLAVHYFEAQWLLTDDFIEPDIRWKRTPEVMDRYWWQAAALTPCFVMTVYQVPKYFKLFEKPGEPSRFDVGRIDLLIVDEAGQVDTPLGLPSFALASRVLVVGDEKQLAPVWSIDEQTDREVAQSAGIPSREWSEDLQERGLTCSAQSSLMRAASHASSWSYGTGAPGLFLAEHFRCHPDIIEFCNTLLYDGLLQAKRPARSSKLDGVSPSFLWVEVSGSDDSKQGSSRKNEQEAKAIAAWIVGNYAHFFEIYHSQESDPNKRVAENELIGVVTPFSAQAALIGKELEKAARAADASANLPDQLWKKVTVGTAHRLQGAERPIVLFSAAYGQSSPQAGFIDANPELMNVAVSRAKDLFIVFAAANRWNNGDVFSVMSKFAQRSDALFALGKDPMVSVAEDVTVPPSIALADEDVTVMSPLTEPTQTEESGAYAASLSVVLKGWREAGELRAEDADMNARALNARLSEAGVLVGEPGAWEPSKLARALGVVVEQRYNALGEQYGSIAYTSQMQDLLLRLYLDEKL